MWGNMDPQGNMDPPCNFKPGMVAVSPLLLFERTSLYNCNSVINRGTVLKIKEIYQLKIFITFSSYVSDILKHPYFLLSLGLEVVTMATHSTYIIHVSVHVSNS